MTKIDLETEIRYWREQCDVLKKDVRVLKRELYWKDFYGKDKYQEFKDWVIINHSDVWIVKGIFDAFEKEYDKGIVDLLNEQEEEIMSLKSTNMELEDANARLEERINELKTRNKRQYNLLTEITDLMMKRDWKGLEKIVEDWEESDILLQAEWGNCGDVE